MLLWKIFFQTKLRRGEERRGEERRGEERRGECPCPDCACSLSLLCSQSCCHACVTESDTTMKLFCIVVLLQWLECSVLTHRTIVQVEKHLPHFEIWHVVIASVQKKWIHDFDIERFKYLNVTGPLQLSDSNIHSWFKLYWACGLFSAG